MTMAWYPHFMSDYESDTTHLSLMEHGAYRLLLDHYYKKRRPLPANASLLHRVCRAFASDEQAAVQRVLDEFFILEEDGYHQKRADKEITKAVEISEKRSAAANLRHSKHSDLEPPSDSKNGHKSSSAKAVQMHSKSSASAPANAMQVDTQLTTHIKERDPAEAAAVLSQVTDLIEFRGGSRQGAGSFLGKCLKEYPRDEVEAAASRAVTANAQDPKAYMRGILGGSARKYVSQAEMNRGGTGKVVL